MDQSKAIHLVKTLMARYEPGIAGKRFKWDQKRGTCIPQFLLPRAPRKMFSAVNRHMARGVNTNVEWIDPHLCFSNQRVLDRRTLIRKLRRYTEWRSCNLTKLPHVFAWRGKFFVWDGNHRLTSALLRGEHRIRAAVMRPKRTLKGIGWITHGKY